MKLSKVSYSYNGKDQALTEIDMDLNSGKIIGIIGINGSGKSTLFLNMVGVLKPSKGEVLYKGKPICYDKKSLNQLRKEIGIVFQDPDQQIFYADVYEDVAFALRNMGLSEEIVKMRVEEALEKVGALHLKERPVQSLSYGQKKRIAIASILAMKQKIVLLDEPTAGLDPRSVERMISIIKEMEQEGIKVILSSHDMDLMYNVCDYIYVLDRGKLVSSSSADDVFSKEEKLIEIGLGVPWLVKVHKNMGLPLFKREEELYEYYKTIKYKQ